jgi:hypothetical protein
MNTPADFPFRDFMLQNIVKKTIAIAAPVFFLMLSACAQPLGTHQVSMPGADDENHPAALRLNADDSQPPSATMQATLMNLISFPDPGGR